MSPISTQTASDSFELYKHCSKHKNTERLYSQLLRYPVIDSKTSSVGPQRRQVKTITTSERQTTTILEKFRSRNYRSLAVETVLNVEQGIPGWVMLDDPVANMLVYWVAPNQTPIECLVFDFKKFNQFFKENQKEWDDNARWGKNGFGYDTTQYPGRDRITEFMSIPKSILIQCPSAAHYKLQGDFFVRKQPKTTGLENQQTFF